MVTGKTVSSNGGREERWVIGVFIYSFASEWWNLLTLADSPSRKKVNSDSKSVLPGRISTHGESFGSRPWGKKSRDEVPKISLVLISVEFWLHLWCHWSQTEFAAGISLDLPEMLRLRICCMVYSLFSGHAQSCILEWDSVVICTTYYMDRIQSIEYQIWAADKQ